MPRPSLDALAVWAELQRIAARSGSDVVDLGRDVRMEPPMRALLAELEASDLITEIELPDRASVWQLVRHRPAWSGRQR